MANPSIHQSTLRFPLNEILGSRAAVRVLRELCRHGGDLSVSHLAALTRLTAQGVRDALAGLGNTNIIEAIGSGKTMLYRLRRTHPLADILDALFLAEAKRDQEIRDAIKEAADRPGVIACWLYGSYARGNDQSGSDLDIALVIDMDSPCERTDDAIRDQLRQIGDRLGFTPSVVTIGTADVLHLSHGDPWWINIAAEAIPLKGQRPSELAASIKRKA